MLDSIYSARCCTPTGPTAEGGGLDLSKLLGRAVNAVHKGKSEKERQQLTDAYGAHFADGVQQGYGKGMWEAKWDSPDAEAIRHLNENAYLFSFAKTREQMQAMTSAIYGPDGKLLPFKEFSELAKRVNNEFAVHHLKTEHANAVAAGAMASKWNTFKKEADQFPNLTYKTIGDANVRESHAALDNVTRPINDVFWQSNYPPNSWGCRCDVEQSVGGAVTPPDKIVYPPDTPAMFKTNMAEGGMAFPPGHEYFKVMSADERKAARQKNPFAYNKEHTGKDGGYVYKAAASKPMEKELIHAKSLADAGEKVIILPDIGHQGKHQLEVRKLCLPPSIVTNVDATVNGRLADFKQPEKGLTDAFFANALKSIGKKVTPGTEVLMLIRFPEKVDRELFLNLMKLEKKRTKLVKEVWVTYHDGSLEKISRFK